MSDNIEIPIIEITDGWTVDEVLNEDDCDDAFAVLTAICVSIESRMDDLAIRGEELSVEHKIAKAALRWKKAALNVVNTKRGKFRRIALDEKGANYEARLVAYFKAMHPDHFSSAVNHVAAMTDQLVIEQTGGTP